MKDSSLKTDQEPLLRKGTEDDLTAICELYKSACRMPGCTWNDYYPTKDDAAGDISADCLYVYVLGGSVIGAVSVVRENELDGLPCWSGNNGSAREIARVTISEKLSGQGLAVRMLDELFAVLKAQNCGCIHLLAARGNKAALRTYEKLGFTFLCECEMYGNTYYAGEKRL